MPLEKVNDATAQRLVLHYVCAACWGTLVRYFTEDRMNIVQCTNCQEETPGYVTRTHVEHKESQDHWDYMEAKKNLAGLGLK